MYGPTLRAVASWFHRWAPLAPYSAASGRREVGQGAFVMSGRNHRESPSGLKVCPGAAAQLRLSQGGRTHLESQHTVRLLPRQLLSILHPALRATAGWRPGRGCHLAAIRLQNRAEPCATVHPPSSEPHPSQLRQPRPPNLQTSALPLGHVAAGGDCIGGRLTRDAGRGHSSWAPALPHGLACTTQPAAGAAPGGGVMSGAWAG